MLTPQPLPSRSTVTRTTIRRRGVAAILAMMFLVIFGTLAVGFYASTTISVQVASNDAKQSRAQLAAESGLDFMRWHLASAEIPMTATPAQVMVKLHEQLTERLEATGNLDGGTVTFDGESITIPAIALGDASQFSARVALADPSSPAADVKVSVTGTAGGAGENGTSATYYLSMTFGISQRTSRLFDFGLATRGAVTLDSNARVRGITDPARGTILITGTDLAPALKLAGNAQVSGKVSLVNGNNAVQKSGNSSINNTTVPVAGPDTSADIALAIVEPAFPDVDTSMFRQYAGNPTYGGTTVTSAGKKFDKADVKNVLIKANTNPTFDGNIRVDGVVYIEAPNKVTFSSNVTIRGVIVAENNATGEPGKNNQVTFNSNVKLQGLETLPATKDFPSGLRQMAGALILAPGFLVHVNSNFGAAGGHMVASQFRFNSNARGSIFGSVINLDEYPVHLDSNADLAFGTSALGNGPGLHFAGQFLPQIETYTEGL